MLAPKRRCLGFVRRGRAQDCVTSLHMVISISLHMQWNVIMGIYISCSQAHWGGFSVAAPQWCLWAWGEPGQSPFSYTCSLTLYLRSAFPWFQYKPVTLLSLLGSYVVTGSLGFEGWLTPCLLTAFMRNWYVCPSARPKTGCLQVFTGFSLHGTQSSDPATHLRWNTAHGLPAWVFHNTIMSFSCSKVMTIPTFQYSIPGLDFLHDHWVPPRRGSSSLYGHHGISHWVGTRVPQLFLLQHLWKHEGTALRVIFFSAPKFSFSSWILSA